MSSDARAATISLHLTPEAVWREQQGKATYRPERFAVDGFIHCTLGEALVLEVGNRYYREDRRPYVLLDVDLSRVGSPVRVEEDRQEYPHIHGPLAQEAIVRIRHVVRAADGTFVAIDDALST